MKRIILLLLCLNLTLPCLGMGKIPQRTTSWINKYARTVWNKLFPSKQQRELNKLMLEEKVANHARWEVAYKRNQAELRLANDYSRLDNFTKRALTPSWYERWLYGADSARLLKQGKFNSNLSHRLNFSRNYARAQRDWLEDDIQKTQGKIASLREEDRRTYAEWSPIYEKLHNELNRREHQLRTGKSLR